jgi:hypothetical protein
MAVDRADVPPALLALLESDELDSVLEMRHPEYEARSKEWRVLIDAFEGGGGFSDGEYLWAFPRESQGDYQRRQASARYINHLGPIIELYQRLIFTQSVRRTSKYEPFNQWLEDVDGAGTPINDLLKRLVALSLTSGHAGVLVDRTANPIDGIAMSDDRNRVIATAWGATAIADWAFEGTTLASVKLIEATPRPSVLKLPPREAPECRYLIWDETGFARLEDSGLLLSAGRPNLGFVPFFILRPAPSYHSHMVGRPIVGSGNVLRALFNRMSEEDTVLRDQAFSILTVSVGADASVERAREQLGDTIGTSKALVVQGTISYQTPDQSVPATIRESVHYLVQEIYRAAHLRFRRDSLSAESGESIRLQYTELDESLQGLARSLAALERNIARAWFAWSFPTPVHAEQAFRNAQPEAVYPTEFVGDDLSRDLDALIEALRLDLGPTMNRRIRKRAVRRVDPDIPSDELAQIDSEIDAQGDVQPATDTGDPEADAIATIERSMHNDD